MKFQVGDIVRYLNAVGGGSIIKIINSNLVEITDESGFNIPVRVEELILIERPAETQTNGTINTSQVTESEQQVPTEEIEGNDNPHLFIAFVRNQYETKKFDTYIINDSNFNILFVLSQMEETTLNRITSGNLDANTKEFVCSISIDEIQKYETLHFTAVCYKMKKFNKQKAIDCTIPIHSVKFYKPGVFTINDFFDEDAYVIDFYNAIELKHNEEEQKQSNIQIDEIKKTIEQKDNNKIISKSPTPKPEKIKEVDLHIHELVDDTSGMLPSQMLDLQLKTFEEKLAEAIKEHCEKVVFIHGVGNGILKAKIRGRLDRDYPQFFYQDADYQKYKVGATLVYLHKVYK